MKPSNFTGAPRSLSEATFQEWGCAIERPEPRGVPLAYAILGWGVAVLAVWTLIWWAVTR